MSSDRQDERTEKQFISDASKAEHDTELNHGHHDVALLAHLDMAPEEEKRILRRIDLRVVPFISLLYLMSFLDRVNIGQAATAGLRTDLKLTSQEYSIALTVFFVSYVAFEVPGNLLFKRLQPHRFITACMFLWGVVMTLMGLVTNFAGLAAARFFLGVAESPLFPALNFLLTTFYKREEQNFRIGVFFSGATLSGSFGGILAYGIRHMNGVGGKPGWAWIFILEGLLTVVISLFSWWLVPDFPETVKFFTEEERAKWLHRLRKSQGLSNASLPFTWKQVIDGFTDWKTYVYATLYISIAQPFYSLSLFVPSIIVGLGYSGANANLLSVPPYALGFLTVLITAWLSDRWLIRGPIICGLMLIVCVGYIILLCDVAVGVKYFAIFLTVAAVSPCIATSITFVGNNSGPIYTRATVMGIFFSAGNSAGIISSNVYPANTAPRYIEGHAVALAFAALAIICAAVLSLWNHRENKKRDAKFGKPHALDTSTEIVTSPEMKEKYGLSHLTDQEVLSLGVHHSAFRFII